jgi:hypothetical protein
MFCRPMSSQPRLSPVAVLALALPLLAFECQTTHGPPPAAGSALDDGIGAPDPAVLDTWIHATETARGLAFVRRPTLEILEPDAPAFEALRAAMPFPLERREGPWGSRPAERVAVDVPRARVAALRPVDDEEVLLALAFLLDAQHYPRLVENAARATGDVGRTLRGLLVASAIGTARGGYELDPPAAEPLPDLLAEERLEPNPAMGPFGALPVFGAQVYLHAQRNREAAFRAPPLSSEQLLRPAQGHGADRPAWLAGAVAAPAGCEVASDESLGVWTLLYGLIERGAEAPARGLAAWTGDRLVRWRCEPERAAWLYVAQLDDEAGAHAFAAVIPLLLPPDLEGDPLLQRRGRRVVVSSGLAPAEADAIARSLRAVELRSAEQAVALMRGGT